MESGKCNVVPYPVPVHGLPAPNAVAYRKLSLGKLHSVALTNTGDVYSWGGTGLGRCGFSAQKAIGKQHGISLPRKVEGLLKNEFVCDIATGDKHTLALTESGKIYSWGCGEDGQLGHGISIKKVDYPRIIEDFEFAKLVVSPSSIHGNPSAESKENSSDIPSSLLRVESIYAAGNYSVALTNTKDVFTWGYGDAGQLGHSPDVSDLSSLPHVDPSCIYTFEERICDAQSFDSMYNTLLPKRIKCVREVGLDVVGVACGPSHLILLCTDEDKEQHQTKDSVITLPQTLYELEMHRPENFS